MTEEQKQKIRRFALEMAAQRALHGDPHRFDDLGLLNLASRIEDYILHGYQWESGGDAGPTKESEHLPDREDVDCCPDENVGERRLFVIMHHNDGTVEVATSDGGISLSPGRSLTFPDCTFRKSRENGLLFSETDCDIGTPDVHPTDKAPTDAVEGCEGSENGNDGVRYVIETDHGNLTSSGPISIYDINLDSCAYTDCAELLELVRQETKCGGASYYL